MQDTWHEHSAHTHISALGSQTEDCLAFLPLQALSHFCPAVLLALRRTLRLTSASPATTRPSWLRASTNIRSIQNNTKNPKSQRDHGLCITRHNNGSQNNHNSPKAPTEMSSVTPRQISHLSPKLSACFKKHSMRHSCILPFILIALDGCVEIKSNLFLGVRFKISLRLAKIGVSMVTISDTW